MATPNFEQLLEAGCHFGHLKRKWNPAMAPYIFMERNGIHIIDLYKTIAKLDEASAALKNIAKAGKKILFVATKKQAKQVLADKASAIGMPYVIERWPGGMLTNFPTIRKAVKKMASIDKMTKDGTFDNLSKREKLQITRQRAKEHIAVAEANRLGIPVFGIVDTNSDPSTVDFIIPANDDASKSIEVILDCVCSAIAEGVEERKVEKVDNKDAAEGEEVKPKRARISRRNKPAEETEEIATDDAEISDSAENNATEENAAAE